MSSCQDSMDTEDSIPRPEYEDIVPDDNDDDVDDDALEFWTKKSTDKVNSIESGSASGSGQENSSATLTNDSGETYTPTSTSTSSTQSQSFEDVNADATVQGSYDGDEDEISYDEADENFEREQDDLRKGTEENKLQTPEQEGDKKKDSLPTPASLNKKLLLAAMVNENGKLVVPITRTGHHVIALTREKETLAADENNTVRSSTPGSGRASREFIALQKSFTESKVLSEFVSEKDRQRKSRKVPLKSEDSTGDVSDREKFKICRSRSKSCTRTPTRMVTVLNSSAPQKWPSDEKLNSKRENMRSQNTDFVQKQMKFLNRVRHDNTGEDLSEISDGEQSLNEGSKTMCSLEVKDDCWQPPPKRGADSFCWKCRKCVDLIACSRCPRSYHYRCIKVSTTTKLDRTWICPECVNLENCINGTKKTKKEALSIDMLNQLLMFALKRMKQIRGHEKLLDPPDENECPLYSQYVVNPVSLNSIQEKIEKKAFRCTEEFVLETKWIQHNVSIAYAAYGAKDGLLAKNLLKICRQEAAEIETCSECYLNANTHKDWFVDVCLKPHILLWAKLKGFPYWPAKGMGIGPNSLVNVRFFGDHDRAFVPVKDCFLYSEVDPNPNSGKRSFRPGIADCIKEVDVHIEKIKAKVGAFRFAPAKTLYDPNKEQAQLEEMMPGVTEYVKKQQTVQKPPLTYKIVKTPDNSLSIIKKVDSGTESDQSMGAEKIKNNVNVTSDPPKPSPLSEEPKPKETHAPEQNSSSPKNASSSSKGTSSKTVSLNYEVVAKPPNKDEANSSKITSVILKRKSDIVISPPNVKKSKSSEDIIVKEYLISSSLTTPKSQEPPVDTMSVVPAKRMRPNDCGDKPTSSSETRVVVPFRIESQTQVNVHKGITVQKVPPQSQSQPQPQTVAKQSSPDSGSNEPSLAVAKLVQNRQGVTIKKLTKKQSSLSTFFNSDESSASTISRFVEQLNNPMRTTTPKAIPLPGVPAKHVQVVAKPQQIAAKSPPSSTPAASTASTAPTPKAMTPPAQAANTKTVQTSTPPAETEKPPNQNRIIPRMEIKVEKPDDEPQSQAKPNTLTVNQLKISSGNETRSTNSQSTPVKATCSKPPVIPINPELVKTENVSDEESQTSAPSSQDNPSSIIDLNSILLSQSVEHSRPGTDPNRIVVRSIEALSRPPSNKSAPSSHTAPTSSSGTSPSTPGQPKKSHARARKSFPNKGPSVSALLLPQDGNNRSLTKNSMVYIPVDIQNISVPVQPLTAVSKPISQASLVHVSIPTSISISLPLVNNSCDTAPVDRQASTSTQTPKPSTSLPSSSSPAASTRPVATTPPAMATRSTASTQPTTPTQTAAPTQPASSPAPSMPPPQLQTNSPIDSDSVSITNFLNSVNSQGGRQSYVASLKTLSPLQLTEAPASTATTSAPDAMSDKNSHESDGHILAGIVTPSLAAAITDSIVRGPPRLTPRPNGAIRSDASGVFNSEAGPLSRALVDNAHKITDFFISVMQDTIGDLANADILPAKIAELQLELEARTASYEQRMAELKKNTDAMLCEMKKNMEIESMRIMAETRKQCEIERIRAVEQTKKKQWCAKCGREANSYCCWNTAYCDTTCQGMDWVRHKPSCCQVNPHLSPELQGPGVLHSAPIPAIGAPPSTTASNNATVTTAPLLNAGLANASGAAKMHIYSQPTPLVTACISTKTPIPISQRSASTSVGTNKTASNSQAPPVSQSNTECSHKGKEIMKLPASTFVRAVPQTIRIAAPPPMHRFNIPLPIGAASSTSGPPYTLIQREGNWELMGTPQQVPMTVTLAPSSSASFQQSPRFIAPVAHNLPQDSRTQGQVLVRPNQM